MNDPRKDPQMMELGEDERVAAFDMLLRGALAPHLCCGHGMGASLATAVTMNVLGAVAAQAGLKAEDLEAEGFWKQLKMNFAAGYYQYLEGGRDGRTVQ